MDNELMRKWMNKWMDARTDSLTGGWMNAQMDK